MYIYIYILQLPTVVVCFVSEVVIYAPRVALGGTAGSLNPQSVIIW